jgi:Mrp family chromosome partitioning ATPase
MSENCDHNCEACTEECAERTTKEDLMESPHPLSRVGKVIGVVSGKGGVGKSLITALLAVSMHRSGYESAVLDADITGPSIPRMFGVKEKVSAAEGGFCRLGAKTASKSCP